MELTQEGITLYLMELFIERNFKYQVLNAIRDVENYLKDKEYIKVSIEKEPKKITVHIKIIDGNKPKCYVVGNEYKFNQSLAAILVYPVQK